MHSFPDTTYLTFLGCSSRFSVGFNPAPIYVNLSVVHWRNPIPPSQVMSPRITSSSPKTSITLNTRILPNTRIFYESKPLFFHRPSLAWTHDSEESIATPPPNSDLDDDQIRALLASSCTYRSERQMRNDHKFITL